MGDIPKHWEIRPVRRLFEIKKRIAGDLGFDVLSITQHGFRIKDTESNEGQQSMDYSKYQLVDIGDFAMNHMDLITGGVDIATAQGVTSPDYRVASIKNPDECHDRYFLRVFQNCFRNRIFYAYGQGSSQLGRWRLPTDQFLAFPFPLPPKFEQAAIAAFLDRESAKLDALVEEQRRLIELLVEKRQTVISHTVTKGLKPNVPMKPSGIEWLGDVPEHWEDFPLRALFSIRHGYAFDGDKFASSGELILMTPGNFKEAGGFRAKIPEKFYVGTDVPQEFILQEGQLLLAMTEQAPGLLGSALFVPGDLAYLHNQRLGRVFGIREDKVDEKFLYYFFNSSRFRAEVSISATGAKVRHTSPQKILSIKTYLPPLFEQSQIVGFLDDETNKICLLISEAHRVIDLLQERRTALIYAAVTGKIDVRGIVEADAA